MRHSISILLLTFLVAACEGKKASPITDQYYTHLNERDNAEALTKVASELGLVPQLVLAEKESA